MGGHENMTTDRSSRQVLDASESNVRIIDPIRASERLLGKTDSKLKVDNYKSVLQDEKEKRD